MGSPLQAPSSTRGGWTLGRSAAQTGAEPAYVPSLGDISRPRGSRLTAAHPLQSGAEQYLLPGLLHILDVDLPSLPKSLGQDQYPRRRRNFLLSLRDPTRYHLSPRGALGRKGNVTMSPGPGVRRPCHPAQPHEAASPAGPRAASARHMYAPAWRTRVLRSGQWVSNTIYILNQRHYPALGPEG